MGGYQDYMSERVRHAECKVWCHDSNCCLCVWNLQDLGTHLSLVFLN